MQLSQIFTKQNLNNKNHRLSTTTIDFRSCADKLDQLMVKIIIESYKLKGSKI